MLNELLSRKNINRIIERKEIPQWFLKITEYI